MTQQLDTLSDLYYPLSDRQSITISMLQAFLLVSVCAGLAVADFVGLDPEQLARAGRQQEDGAVQVRQASGTAGD